MKHVLKRQAEVPMTVEERRLYENASYRQRYLDAYRKQMCLLKTSCICREINSFDYSINQIADQIINLLDIDLTKLDPRKIATGDKVSLRSLYSSWQERVKDQHFRSDKYFIIKPNEYIEFDEDVRQRHKCHFDNLGLVFSYSKFSEPRHPPVHVGCIENRQNFDNLFDENTTQAQDMPVSFRTENPDEYEYRIPIEYWNLREFIQKVVNVYHSVQKNVHHYYAYLTVSHGEVEPWKAQRRPTIHSDGFQGARINPKVETEYSFVAANALPTLFYIESFDVSNLDPDIDNFFVAYSRSSSTLPQQFQKPYDIIMMDPYCLHAPAFNMGDTPIRRTFARIMYSPRIFDRLGNTHNPAFDYHWTMVRREAQMDLPGRKIETM